MDNIQNDHILQAINTLTEKLSILLLQEFLKLPAELQLNLVLIKSTQLLLANILCQVVVNIDELEKIIEEQAEDIKQLTFNSAFSGFSEKFKAKH